MRSRIPTALARSPLEKKLPAVLMTAFPPTGVQLLGVGGLETGQGLFGGLADRGPRGVARVLVDQDVGLDTLPQQGGDDTAQGVVSVARRRGHGSARRGHRRATVLQR